MATPPASQLIDSTQVQRLGVPEADAMLRFGEEAKEAGTWAGRRLLYLGGEPAYALSFWCGTCGLLFQRQNGATRTMSLEGLQDRLADGAASSAIDAQVVSAFGDLLADDEYVALLLRVSPVLVRPLDAEDYFAHEQVATWGISAFWGLPEYPFTAYYRTYQTAVDADTHFYEFVVPMVPPTWNEPVTVQAYAEAMTEGAEPTAVAVSVLDVSQPAMSTQSTDYYAHWGLTHFLMDGHHKFEAAARSGRPIRLLSLLSVGGSLADQAQVQRLVSVRGQPPMPRG